jgi:hypothetical protein
VSTEDEGLKELTPEQRLMEQTRRRIHAEEVMRQERLRRKQLDRQFQMNKRLRTEQYRQQQQLHLQQQQQQQQQQQLHSHLHLHKALPDSRSLGHRPLRSISLSRDVSRVPAVRCYQSLIHHCCALSSFVFALVLVYFKQTSSSSARSLANSHRTQSTTAAQHAQSSLVTGKPSLSRSTSLYTGTLQKKDIDAGVGMGMALTNSRRSMVSLSASLSLFIRFRH